MTQSTPMMSVIFPTYNRSAVVEETLRRLMAQTYPHDRIEVLVCDNSSDDTPDMVERLAAEAPFLVRLLASNERLPAVKRNQGLRAAQGDLVVFLNDDVWVEPDFLAEHAASHERHDEPVAVLGHVEQSRSMPRTPFIEWYQPFAYDDMATFADRPVPYRYFWSMNLSLPREEMLARNLVFHEDWAEIGHEDVELGYRWAKAGLAAIYNPRARGEHFHPHTLSSACALQRSIGRGLRDLEVLIPEPDLPARYGVFSWRNPPRAVVRSAARKILFNGVTVPVVRRWLTDEGRPGAVAQWSYWKVMLHFADRGYRAAPARSPEPTPTRAPSTTGVESK